MLITPLDPINGAHTKRIASKHITTKHIVKTYQLKTYHIQYISPQNVSDDTTYQLAKHINDKTYQLQNISFFLSINFIEFLINFCFQQL